MDIELDKSIQFKPFYFETDRWVYHLGLSVCSLDELTNGRHRSVFNYFEIKVWWFFSFSSLLKQLWTVYKLLILAHLFFSLVNDIIEEIKNPSLVPCSWGRNLFKLCTSSLQILWIEGFKGFNRRMMTNSPRGHRTKSEWGSCFRKYYQLKVFCQHFITDHFFQRVLYIWKIF